MKKPTNNCLEYQDITIQKRTKRNLVSKEKAKKRRRNKTHGIKPSLHTNKIGMPGRTSVASPSHLQLSYDNNDLCSYIILWIRALKEKAAKKRIYIDFSQLVECDLASLLLLTSEVRQIQEEYGKDSIRCTVTGGNTFMTKVLKGSGIISLINDTKLHDWMNGWDMPIIHGDASGEKDFTTLTDYLLNTYLPDGIPEDERARVENLIYKAISEGILNVEQHAYDGSEKIPLDRKKWWCATFIFGGYFYLVLCDRGIGIPNHLPKSGLWEKLRKHIFNDDAQMIHAAMTLTRTSRDSFVGGYGTKDIQDLVAESESGNLLLFSNKGVYRLDNNDGEIKSSSYKLKASIDGTIISWKLALPK